MKRPFSAKETIVGCIASPTTSLWYQSPATVDSELGSLSTCCSYHCTMATINDPTVKAVVRERQWIYLGPIIAAPMAHIAVTMYRSAKTVRQKQIILGVGIVGSTVMTLSMRLWLMAHAGYPGMEAAHLAQGRIKTVSMAEKEAIEQPSTAAQLKEALRGFG